MTDPYSKEAQARTIYNDAQNFLDHFDIPDPGQNPQQLLQKEKEKSTLSHHVTLTRATPSGTARATLTDGKLLTLEFMPDNQPNWLPMTISHEEAQFVARYIQLLQEEPA